MNKSTAAEDAAETYEERFMTRMTKADLQALKKLAKKRGTSGGALIRGYIRTDHKAVFGKEVA